MSSSVHAFSDLTGEGAFTAATYSLVTDVPAFFSLSSHGKIIISFLILVLQGRNITDNRGDDAPGKYPEYSDNPGFTLAKVKV